MGTLFVDKLDPQSGTSLEIGSSGDTITIPSGATITNNGTQTGFGGVNTPAFHAFLSSAQTVSDNTQTVIAFDSETFDSGSVYNTSNYRFTPTAGKYFIYAAATLRADHVSQLVNAQINIRKNGGTVIRNLSPDYRNNSLYIDALTINSIVVANGTDYFEIRAKINDSSNVNCTIAGDSEQPSFFGAFKIIE